jgi:hypothetical protein
MNLPPGCTTLPDDTLPEHCIDCEDSDGCLIDPAECLAAMEADDWYDRQKEEL